MVKNLKATKIHFIFYFFHKAQKTDRLLRLTFFRIPEIPIFIILTYLDDVFISLSDLSVIKFIYDRKISKHKFRIIWIYMVAAPIISIARKCLKLTCSFPYIYVYKSVVYFNLFSGGGGPKIIRVTYCKMLNDNELFLKTLTCAFTNIFFIHFTRVLKVMCSTGLQVYGKKLLGDLVS